MQLELADSRRKLQAAVQRLRRERFRPAPTLSVSQWADTYRMLPEGQAEPGKWRTSRVPYLREVMDTASDPDIERACVMKAAQVGYSEALLNVLGYFIDQDPAPMLLVQISVGEAAKFSKERVAPTIASTPRLRGKVAAPKSRDSNNTIESKGFAGGHLGIVGANAPSGLRSRPRRVILFDEVDGYPVSAGDEGDPIELAEKRASTFWNRYFLMGSTPDIEETSRIAKAWNESDQRHYLVPCPHCGHPQRLEWGRVKWDKAETEEGHRHLPETAAYECAKCEELIRERSKFQMLRDGEWVPDHPGRKIRGYHISGLLSPWVTWAELADEFLKAGRDPSRLQVFWNTRLGLPWSMSGDVLDEDRIMARAETYPTSPLPPEVVLLTAGVDVQADRLECEVVGWGVGEETWSVDYFVIEGDPTGPQVWQDLDGVLLRRWDRQSDMPPLGIAAAAVDSGFETQQVYRFCGPRMARRVWAVKGISGPRPILDKPKRRRGKVAVFPAGVDTAKMTLYSRLEIDEPGPGFCHFPKRPPYDAEWFRQLTSEVSKPGIDARTGLPTRQWFRRPNRRGEVLDCRVYAICAFEGLVAGGVRLEVLAEQAEPQDAAGTAQAQARPSRRAGWVSRY